MFTVTVQIGNSDNKLSRVEWVAYWGAVGTAIDAAAKQVHFSGHSSPVAPWQNAAFVFEIETDKMGALQEELIEIRKTYHQDSLAFTPAPYTLFI